MVSSTVPGRDPQESIMDEEITEALILDPEYEFLGDANEEIEHAGSGLNWNFGDDPDALGDMERLIWALAGDHRGVGGDNRHYDYDFTLSIDDLSGSPQMWPEEVSTSYPNADDGIVADLARAIGVSPDVENDMGLHINDPGSNTNDLVLHANDLGPNIHDRGLHNNDNLVSYNNILDLGLQNNDLGLLHVNDPHIHELGLLTPSLGTDIHDLGLHMNDPHIHQLGLLAHDLPPHIYEADESLDDPILNQLADDMVLAGLSGNRPASKFAVNTLVEKVEMRPKEGSEGMLCAVCKEELSFASLEQVRKLPCSHFFHADCILPWLRIQNTCPVCRYELPTNV